MRLAAARLFAFCALGCATAPKLPPPLPPPTAVTPEQIPPAPGPPTIPANVALYEDKPVRKGVCPGMPSGILVSPANYALRYWALKDRERLLAEAQSMRQLRLAEQAASAAAEQACRARAAELERTLATRLSPWRVAVLVVFGAVGGAVVAILARPARP